MQQSAATPARSAFTEITSLVKQKAATDQARRSRSDLVTLAWALALRLARESEELLSEIHALGRQLSMKTAELEVDTPGPRLAAKDS